ncbi:hypothetical protein tinsulaeT_14030 [Thalassotalea insulae]|uniref:Anti-sigma factor n=1 Tax=Thalassotalea insulae TaxID=2056778 RepID=A0ABQ6GQ07_9GAMM|nr:hypothetical protein [Thalassotalea insulae]GLX78063.1 hypothetical protein tinsulaeT_14030 [Thalassotalea insulae]
MKKVISDQSLEQQVAQLPKEMEPKRDLWRGIEKAIALTPQQAEKRSSVVSMAWAASIVVAVLVSWLSLSPQQGNVPESITIVSTLEKDFEQQKQVMLTNFGQPELSELPKEMQEQLNELSSARSAISNALANDPDNKELLNLLRWTQQQEIQLLKQLYTPQWQTI